MDAPLAHRKTYSPGHSFKAQDGCVSSMLSPGQSVSLSHCHTSGMQRCVVGQRMLQTGADVATGNALLRRTRRALAELWVLVAVGDAVAAVVVAVAQVGRLNANVRVRTVGHDAWQRICHFIIFERHRPRQTMGSPGHVSRLSSLGMPSWQSFCPLHTRDMEMQLPLPAHWNWFGAHGGLLG